MYPSFKFYPCMYNAFTLKQKWLYSLPFRGRHWPIWWRFSSVCTLSHPEGLWYDPSRNFVHPSLTCIHLCLSSICKDNSKCSIFKVTTNECAYMISNMFNRCVCYHNSGYFNQCNLHKQMLQIQNICMCFFIT